MEPFVTAEEAIAGADEAPMEGVIAGDETGAPAAAGMTEVIMVDIMDMEDIIELIPEITIVEFIDMPIPFMANHL